MKIGVLSSMNKRSGAGTILATLQVKGEMKIGREVYGYGTPRKHIWNNRRLQPRILGVLLEKGRLKWIPDLFFAGN
ncbi:MAG: hypothetical protein JXR72_08125 [Proteobacteria bacterium]|nr:hypothetical protein [Pseudomonadota bacterium]